MTTDMFMNMLSSGDALAQKTTGASDNFQAASTQFGMKRDKSHDGFMSFSNPPGVNFMNTGNNAGGNDERTPRNCELLAPVP